MIVQPAIEHGEDLAAFILVEKFVIKAGKLHVFPERRGKVPACFRIDNTVR